MFVGRVSPRYVCVYVYVYVYVCVCEWDRGERERERERERESERKTEREKRERVCVYECQRVRGVRCRARTYHANPLQQVDRAWGGTMSPCSSPTKSPLSCYPPQTKHLHIRRRREQDAQKSAASGDPVLADPGPGLRRTLVSPRSPTLGGSKGVGVGVNFIFHQDKYSGR